MLVKRVPEAPVSVHGRTEAKRPCRTAREPRSVGARHSPETVALTAAGDADGHARPPREVVPTRSGF
ncbi:hypothetical protein EVAR_66415_1 [Eumeta japonica]|uniref:Uncharacterized protein n=1 Tax=Eumeta variegata TaxID=151549 RepID=A0A4C2A7G9_EUMVA|nr:hypothetical protein EVAR_66415_1 [Eumeta japonica]